VSPASPAVTLIPWARGEVAVRVAGRRPLRDPRIEGAWRAALAANDRLFDGPILAVGAIDPAAGVIHARPERFSHLVCPPPDGGASILSVTGVVLCEGRVLLGRRGGATRSYPGLWELGPSGGLAPPGSPRTLGMADVLACLRAELAEEVGLTAMPSEPRTVAVVADAKARSVDLVVRVELPGPPPPLRAPAAHAWEYERACWMAVGEAAALMSERPAEVIAPTLAIARWLGWLG